MDPLQKKGGISFRQGIKEHEISDGSTIKKKTFSNPPPTSKGGRFSSILYRFGGMAERGTANPFSPVQIWVSPD